MSRPAAHGAVVGAGPWLPEPAATPTRRRPGGASLATFALFVVLAAVTMAVLLAHQATLHQDIQAPSAASVDLLDFRDTVWSPVRDLLAGHNPYAVYQYVPRHPGQGEFDLYSPWWLVLVLPVAVLPYHVAAAVWLLALLAAVVVAVRLLLADVPRRWRWPATWLTATLAIGLFTGRDNLHGGQATALVALGLTVAVTQARRRPWLAGAGLALAAVKPQFGIGLLVAFLAARAWPVVSRAVAVAAAVGLPAVVACVLTSSPAGFVRSVRDNLDYSSTAFGTGLDSPLQSRLDLVGVLSRLTRTLPTGAVQLVAQAALLAGVVAVVRLGARRGLGLADHRVLAAVVALVLLGFVHQSYDLLLLVVPAVLTARAAVAAGTRPSWRAAWVLAVVVAVPLLHPRRLDSLVTGRSVSFAGSVSADGLWLLAVVAAAVVAVLAAPAGGRHRRARTG